MYQECVKENFLGILLISFEAFDIMLKNHMLMVIGMFLFKKVRLMGLTGGKLLLHSKLNFEEENFMKLFKRILKLKNLEILKFFKESNTVCYIFLEDTRRPLSKEDIKRVPLCYMEEEDINEILNVFKISFISEEKLKEEDSYFLRTFFSELVNNTDVTTFIMDEFVKKDLYDDPDLDEVPFFNNLLTYIDSDIVLSEIDDHKWMYLSQD
ncbi:hypothetical protein AB0X74_13405 [Kurthia gibsonii]|uniref:hypothetical protein n=1 Tax=Kurthia gibsonii TaxID=33946 RepID=UPI003F2263F5